MSLMLSCSCVILWASGQVGHGVWEKGGRARCVAMKKGFSFSEAHSLSGKLAVDWFMLTGGSGPPAFCLLTTHGDPGKGARSTGNVMFLLTPRPIKLLRVYQTHEPPLPLRGVMIQEQLPTQGLHFPAGLVLSRTMWFVLKGR